LWPKQSPISATAELLSKQLSKLEQEIEIKHKPVCRRNFQHKFCVSDVNNSHLQIVAKSPHNNGNKCTSAVPLNF